MKDGHVLRCNSCRSEFAFVKGYTESIETCYQCLHPSTAGEPTMGRASSWRSARVSTGGERGTDPVDAGHAPTQLTMEEE